MEYNNSNQTSQRLEVRCTWQSCDPNSASDWFVWKDKFLSLNQKYKTEVLPPSLNLTPIALAALNHAFSRGLSRQTGWKIADTTHAPCLQAAASIFRRGVATDLHDTSQAGESKHARYEIKISQSNEPPKLNSHSKKQFIVIDENVWPLWKDKLDADLHPEICPANEQLKTLDTVAQISSRWKTDPTRSHWIIVGGGIVCDIAAFAASLMGCQFTLVPTTLLAMADASVGGKTGVNFPPYGKNQIGHFAYPHAVEVWPGWLTTLDLEQLSAGGAECYKHALLANDEMLRKEVVESLKTRDICKLSSLLPKIIEIKAQVITNDPLERGERATLNLGHTLAHALESTAHEHGGHLPHGIAVGYGISFAALLSSSVNQFPRKETDTIQQELSSICGLSHSNLCKALNVTTLNESSLEAKICSLIAQDKKNLEHTSGARWILLDKNRRPYQDDKGHFGQLIDHQAFLEHWRQFTAKLKSVREDT